MEGDALVDPAGVYRPVRDVTLVAVGHEAILVRPRGDRLYRLDARARLVWDLLDGETGLDVTVADLAEAFAAPRDVVTRDVSALLASLLASGLVEAADVPAVTAQPVEPPRAEGVDPAGLRPRVVSVPPSACFEASGRRGWAGTDAISVGDIVIGVRSDTEETRAAVRELLAPWLVDGYDVDGNLSVRGPAHEAGRPTQLAEVLSGCTLVGRHRDLDAALEQLRAEVARIHAEECGDPGRLWVECALLVSRDGGQDAVLIPTDLANSWPASRSGARLASSWAVLDPSSASVVIPAPPPAGTSSASAPAEHLRLRGWVLPGAESLGPADRVMQMQASLRSSPVETLETLDALEGLERMGVVVVPRPSSVAELRAVVTATLGGGGDVP